VRGGELSALVALRRDAEQSPEVDHVGEPWAKLSESGAPIEGGTFDLAIADAEGRFNINSVRTGEVASTILFQTIGNEVGLTRADRRRGRICPAARAGHRSAAAAVAGIEPKVAIGSSGW
jgi:type II secretory pathway component PulK